jgi:hypothetical protein
MLTSYAYVGGSVALAVYLPFSEGSADPRYTRPPTMEGILPSAGRPWLTTTETVATLDDEDLLPPIICFVIRYTLSDRCCTWTSMFN